MPKSILICCFDFPPNRGIGGRRWAKFAKGLVSAGCKVHVIKADSLKGVNDSPWSDDVKLSGLVVHSIPRNYPEALIHPRNGLLGKLGYRLSVAKMKRREAGTIYDVASGWGKAFLAKASELVEREGITHVISTGAPFNLLYYSAKLKQKYPELFLLCDYRDPWLTAKNYGMADLSPERMAHESLKQSLVFEMADVITSPASALNDSMRREVDEKSQCTFAELRHAYDSDDIVQKETKGHDVLRGDQIRLIYGGAIYIGLEKFLQPLLNGLDALKLHSQDLYSRLKIDLYTPDQQHCHMFSAHEDKICIHGPIGKRLFQEINQSNAALILQAEHNKEFFTTKFFELLPMQKPLMYFGPSGSVSRYIGDEHLGISVQTPEQFVKAVVRLAKGRLPAPDSKQANAHSLNSRTQELLKLLG